MENPEADARIVHTIERTVAVLQAELVHMRQDNERYHAEMSSQVHRISTQINDSLATRLTIVEQRLGTVDQALLGFRGFIAKVVTSVVITVLVAFGTSYLAIQHRSENAQQHLERMERELAKLRQPQP